MKLTDQIAKHFRDFHFGGNWTGSNLRDSLAGVTWQQATTRVYSFHTIATLVFHMNYYVSATIQVLQGGPLEAHDKYSFDMPPVQSREDWENLLQKTWTDAGEFADLVERLPDEDLCNHFVEEKYGTWFRCLNGPIEHCHYHLGQIVIIKKLLAESEAESAR